MPIRYTYQQVQDIFSQKKCILISETYSNQLVKLDYTASCGHNNTIRLKDFICGIGIKCKKCALDIPSYEVVCKKFTDKNCSIIMTKEEFDENYKNNNCKIKYTACCGHENSVSYKNFITLNQGLNCPKCVNKNTGEKLKEFRVGDNKNSCLQELKCINYFKNLISDKFTTIKTFDGCKADIIIKIIDEENDLWLGIQVKTTYKKTDREQYYFRLNNGQYNNFILLCICEEDKKMWLIPYEEVNGFKTIGIAKKSKYNKYEVSIENLNDKLNYFYDTLNKFNLEILNTPSSKTQKQEFEYRKLREEKIDFIEFTDNDVEGLVYDFKIDEKKVQEKVGSIIHDNPNSFLFNLIKYKCRVEGKCVNQCYNEGDNDLYWLNCKNGKFYVIPEQELIKHGYIGKECKQKLYVSPTNKNTEWCNNYLFEYDNIDKTRLLKIVNS